MQPTIRSIDLGYGNIKFVTGLESDGTPICRLFPSLAPIATANSLESGPFQSRDTVRVQVNDATYEVGPDVRLALKGYSASDRTKSFVETDAYLARFRGALAYMGVSRIDLLVLGLPVEDYEENKHLLAGLAKGEHPLPDGKKVFIDKVMVFAQPMGGFYNFLQAHSKEHQIRNRYTLVIDPGYVTLDWVFADGFNPVNARSGSYPGGVSKILEEIGNALKDKNLPRIDEGLRTNDYTIHGKKVDLRPYLENAKPAIEEAVVAMANSVGDTAEISRIVLVGGGAFLYQPAIEKRFKGIEVLRDKGSVFSNVRGFQFIGEYLYNNGLKGVA